MTKSRDVKHYIAGENVATANGISVASPLADFLNGTRGMFTAMGIMNKQRYYIISLERLDNALYWKPNSNGYTDQLADAGVYEDWELQYLPIRDPKDIPIPVEVVQAIARKA